RAIRKGKHTPDEMLASMQQRRAHACYLCGQFDEALEAQHAALDLYRKLDDRRRMGESMWSLSRLFRYVGRGPEALESAQEAIRILEQLPAGPELALAYCNLSHLYVNSEDADEAKLSGRMCDGRRQVARSHPPGGACDPRPAVAGASHRRAGRPGARARSPRGPRVLAPAR